MPEAYTWSSAYFYYTDLDPHGLESHYLGQATVVGEKHQQRLARREDPEAEHQHGQKLRLLLSISANGSEAFRRGSSLGCYRLAFALMLMVNSSKVAFGCHFGKAKC